MHDCASTHVVRQKITDEVDEPTPLLSPGMREIGCLASLDDLHDLERMGEHVGEFPHEILHIAQFEEDEGLVVEIVLNARSSRGDDGLAKRQILKDTSRCIERSEYAAMIRHDPDITFL